MKTLFSNNWTYLIVAGLTALLLFDTYTLGSRSGEASIQRQWDAQILKDKRAEEKQREANDKAEAIHRQQVSALQQELRDAQTSHRIELDRIAGEYAGRLLKSEQRASVYQRQAEGGAAECRSLASHAARLDASLEEGRSVVRELRATLGLRDDQLKALADQIKADRQLLN